LNIQAKIFILKAVGIFTLSQKIADIVLTLSK